MAVEFSDSPPPRPDRGEVFVKGACLIRLNKPVTMVARHLAVYRDMIDGRTAPAECRPDWMDPVVRLAIEAYWRTAAGRRRSRGSRSSEGNLR